MPNLVCLAEVKTDLFYSYAGKGDYIMDKSLSDISAIKFLASLLKHDDTNSTNYLVDKAMLMRKHKSSKKLDSTGDNA
jgi:hypothetical protein